MKEFNQFKLPNQSKPSDAMKKPATGGAGGRVYDSVVQSGASAETLEWYDEERIETL